MFKQFGLTLIVNHACNLRCTYCYTGDKFGRRLPLRVGKQAIDRALSSIEQYGRLDLAFFGGEPLMEAELVLQLVDHAHEQAALRDVQLALSMTTNGLVTSPAAWSVMMLSEMRLAVSHDGLPEIHDRFRITPDGKLTSARVLRSIFELLEAGRAFRVVMVVQPSTARSLPGGLDFLYERGVRGFDPSLNLWARWTKADGERLKKAVGEAADFWGDRLPDCSVSWFDEKLARLTRVPITESSRCGFGRGEIAITPMGRMYPCERLVGEDKPTNPMRLPGDVFDAADFLVFSSPTNKSADECSPCGLQSLCNTTRCQCSNYVRTGHVNQPDQLLCLLDQACYRETVRVVNLRTPALA